LPTGIPRRHTSSSILFLGYMMEAVHHYEGTVNQVMGDGIMALFGAPVAHEDHAVRACCAAFRMQETVKRFAEDVRHRGGSFIQIRVGLNSGDWIERGHVSAHQRKPGVPYAICHR
jgi:class 3 adenylate cyclase